jgi:methionine-S-sulfoxide reductase
VGYTGGSSLDPTYHELGDHTEAFQVDFDPEVIAYEELIAAFWASRDHSRPPFSRQYRAAVFVGDDDQREVAHQTAETWAREHGLEVTTAVESLDRFYMAEAYHQKYRLRRERELTRELVDRYGSDEAMVSSTAAARINGLLGGYLRRGELERLLPALSLTPAGEARLQAQIHT